MMVVKQAPEAGQREAAKNERPGVVEHPESKQPAEAVTEELLVLHGKWQGGLTVVETMNPPG